MILYLDFETSPIVGWGWSMYTKGGAFFHVAQHVKIISVAWAVDDGPIYCVAINDYKGYKPGILNIDDKKLIEFFAPKIEAADFVVAHNGKGFDFRLWRTRLICHNLLPHHEPKEIDTKQWAKKFRFTTNTQDNITDELGVSRKIETEKNLHYKCIEGGQEKDWNKMKVYNKGDIKGLREMAKKMAPFITNAPNGNLLRGTVMQCTNVMCEKPDSMIRRGPRISSKTGLRQTYQCKACGQYATGPSVQAGVILR